MVIASFRCKATEGIFNRQPSGKFPRIMQRRARVKLLMLDAATDLNDLRVPPGNRLERLKGKRQGQCSIRINDRWRICFRWRQGNAHDAEIVDYH